MGARAHERWNWKSHERIRNDADTLAHGNRAGEHPDARDRSMIGAAPHPCDRGVAEAAPAGFDAPPRARPWILAATILGSGMVFIDGTVVNVAVPRIQVQFNTSATDVQWVVEAYALFLSALLLVGGSMGDRFGRRRVFVIGLCAFAAASLWCGLASSFAELVIARALQGVGAALLVPGSLAILSASFPEAERGRAIGTWSGFTGITMAFGPVLGGWLIDHASWRWAFFLNLPLAAVVLWLARTHVPETRNPSQQGPPDWIGAALATLALGAIVYGLLSASSRGWGDALVLGALALGVVSAWAFWIAEQRARAPMLPLSLFRSRNFTGANLLTLLLYAALGGGLYFLPLNLIQVQQHSTTAAGAALLPFIGIMFALSRWAGGLIQRSGAKLPLTVGPIIAACGFALLALPGIGGSYWRTFFPGIVVLGLGMAISVAPLTTTVMSSVPRELAGVASGINNAVSRTAGLLALAILGVIMLQVFDRNLEPRLAQRNLTPETRRAILQEQHKLTAATLPPSLTPVQREAIEHDIAASYVAGFRAVMLTSAALALSGALAAWLTISGRPRTRGK
jgi:EmrB/QacA subfamily drug resistance transporter